MRILILEDSKQRIEWFKEIYKHHELHITKNINEAITWCLYLQFDILFLDHDLEENYGTSESNGYMFVKRLIETQTQKRAIIYIHSMNPTGANVMLNRLRDNEYQATWIPYHLLLEEANGD